MADDGEVSVKTWTRAVDPITKAGYMTGAADGQNFTFQSSFDMGYEQGLIFGMELGIEEAMLSVTQQRGSSSQLNMADQRRINCQICNDSMTAQENIVNLYNTQKEKNDMYLGYLKNNKINRTR